jgi:DNA-binding SARP family transcriptional activator
MTEMSLQIGLLGPFRVCVDGERVDVPPRRLRDLLATLALSAGQSVSVDRLATAVWGEDFAVDVRVNLQSNVGPAWLFDCCLLPLEPDSRAR